MKRRALKLAVLSGVVLVAATGVYFWLFSADSGTGASAGAPAPQAVVVEAVRVRVAAVQPSVSAVGTLRSQESIVLRPEIDGRIVELGFEEGQPVHKGQLMVRLESSLYEAELAQAAARLTLSNANYSRAKELVGRGAVSERSRDEAFAQMKMDEASVALATARLAKARIEAPHSGVAGLRKIGIGDYVSAGDPLVTLDVIDPIKLEFRIPEIYLGNVTTGQSVEFALDAWPGKTFDAMIYAIDPQVDVNGRSLSVLARAPNPDRSLRPGLFARISLLLPERPGAKLVPEEAVVPSGTDHFLFRIVDGKVVQTPIEIGLRREGDVEILSGVEAEDVVVTSGHLKLRDGVSVSIRNDLGP